MVRNISGFIITIVLIVIASFALPSRAADEPAQKINVGLQLYSLRNQFVTGGVPKTMATISEMGITDVEAAGFYNLTAEQFKKELDAHHLHASGAHFQWDALSKDIDAAIKDAKTLGVENITCPWIPHDGDTFTADKAAEAIAKFNEWGAKCAAAGIHFSYHAHGYEFRPQADGSTLFDTMVAQTDPKYVNFEIDIFWAYDGGADPVKLMEKYPTRFILMHLKDMKKTVKTPNYTGHEDVENDVALGTGKLDIPAIIKEGVKIGIKHYYIEDESRSSVQQIPQSIQYVRSIGH